MRTRTLVLAIFIAAAVIGISGVLMGAAVASRIDTAQISIHDKHDGTRLVLPVPIGLVSAVASSHLSVHCSDADRRDLENVRAVMNEAAKSLENIPDMVLLEVEDGNDHVTLRKSGGNLLLEVNSPDSRVNITVPRRALSL
jgi:hypothetical protein